MLLFNPKATDDDLKIWNGETTNLLNYEKTPQKWAFRLTEQMEENFWIPKKVDLTRDVTDYNNLTPSERHAYDGILCYLIFLDSLQEGMLPVLGETMTDPVVRECLAEQAMFEGIHSRSYKYMVETIYEEEDRNRIYYFWQDDKILLERIKAVASYYQTYLDSQSNEDYFYALFADYLLEGLYFYNGFNFFYTLASRHLMGGSADIIKLINRDERLHVHLFQKLLNEASSEFTFSQDKLLEMMDHAVSQEITWTNHITENNILGVSEKSTTQYTHYLANLRLRAIGLPAIYEDVPNPYSHLERIADVTSHATSKVNFFESTVTSYQMASAVEGWSDF